MPAGAAASHSPLLVGNFVAFVQDASFKHVVGAVGADEQCRIHDDWGCGEFVCAIQAVVNGSSDTKKRCTKLIQMMGRVVSRVSRDRWWWLIQMMAMKT